MTKTRFGTAGNTDAFYATGKTSTIDAMPYFAGMGLDAFEYQCGRGITVGIKTAVALGKRAAECGIALSLHSPYYVTITSSDDSTRANAINYIIKSAQVLDAMGGRRVVVHSGYVGKTEPRTAALAIAKETLRLAQQALDELGLAHIILCPELMGKMGNLGDLDEVAELCTVDERFVPCIDFGHYNARTHGGLKEKADYEHIIDTLQSAIGADRVRNFHAHFSKIEYTAGGEKRHLTFDDKLFGPDFEPLAEVIAERNLAPVIICESKGTQDIDAVDMKKILQKKGG